MREFSSKTHKKDIQTTNNPRVEAEEIVEPASRLSSLGRIMGSGTPPPLSTRHILQLQSLIGNQAVQRFIGKRGTVVQRDDEQDESGRPQSIDSIVERYIPPQDDRPLAARLRAAQTDHQPLMILLRIAFHDSNDAPPSLTVIQRLVIGASNQERTEVLNDPLAMNAARRRLSEREFHQFDSWLLGGSDQPMHVPGDSRPLNEQLDELLQLGSLPGVISLALAEDAELSVIQPYIERASDRQRTRVLLDRSLLRTASERFSDDDYRALLDALRASHGPSSPEMERRMTWLQQYRRSLRRRLGIALFRWRATFADVREMIVASTPEERRDVWSNQAFLDVARGFLDDADYEDLLVALGVGTRAGGGPGVPRSAAQVDEDIRSHLGTYVQEAIRDGLSIENHVAIVGEAEWRRVIQAHFPRNWRVKITSLSGFYSEETGQAFVRRRGASVSTLLHEALHLYSRGAPGLPNPLEEGITQYFTYRILGRPGFAGPGPYESYVNMVNRILAGLGSEGERIIAGAYFNGEINRLHGEFERAFGVNTWARLMQALRHVPPDMNAANHILGPSRRPVRIAPARPVRVP